MVAKRVWIVIAKHWLIYLGFFINILFYISAYQTKWLDYFFSGSSLHLCCRGLDFYQVPNGAYAYFHGGSFTGTVAPGTKPYGVGYPSNSNVYHPLFTGLVGGLLILFSPASSFYIWMLMKLCITMGLVIYFYRNFKDYKYVNFAIFLMLIDFAQYLEIRISQYQFIFNAFVLLLLINLAKDRNNPLVNGIYYFFSLIVKPMGFLWIPLLLFKGQWKTALLGLLYFTVATAVFLVNKSGDYYTNNLLSRIFTPDNSGPIQIITLDAFLRYSTPLPASILSMIKIAFLVFTLFLSTLKKIHILKAFYLSVVFYLLFFNLVYEYYYTTIVVVLVVCIVACPDFQTKSARVLITIISLPSVFFLLHYFHIGFVQDRSFGPDPTFLGWQLIVLSKIIPIILLSFLVLRSDLRPVYYDLKEFCKAIFKANKSLEVFG